MWCPDPKSPKFVITFDENYMLQQIKESVVDITGSGENASKQVELESKVTEGVQKSTRVEPVDDAQGSTSGDDILQEQQYSIATGRARRQIRPPKRYAYVDMVAYALSVTESIEIPEPCTYNEAISSDEAAEWTVVMTEEIEFLHKNQTWELAKPLRR